MSNAVAGVLFFCVTVYAIFGGADFGAGFWDLVAGGAHRGERPRAQIDHSIGPVWEANHVWLIFSLVVLWTGFPEAFASITLTLFVPLTLAALGIVARGSSFAFRKAVLRTRDRRNFGAAFALSSVLVPYCLGAIAGGIASGEVPAGGQAGDPWSSWINPTSILGGVLAVTACAYLASTFLAWDAHRTDVPDMVGYFRRRALGAAVAAGVVALVGVFVLRADARYVFDGLTSRVLPLVIVSALCGGASLLLALRGVHRWARALAIGAVAAVTVGWGVAQWPYLLPTSLKVSQAAAPSGTLETILLVFVLAVVIVVPSLGLLYVLDQKGLLPEEGTDTGPLAAAGGPRSSAPRRSGAAGTVRRSTVASLITGATVLVGVLVWDLVRGKHLKGARH